MSARVHQYQCVALELSMYVCILMDPGSRVSMLTGKILMMSTVAQVSCCPRQYVRTVPYLHT